MVPACKLECDHPGYQGRRKELTNNRLEIGAQIPAGVR